MQQAFQGSDVSAVVRELCASLGPAAALDMLTDLAREQPDDGAALAMCAEILMADGYATGDPLGDLAARTFPGPGYREHLRALHGLLRPALYLEIGVFDGEALAVANPGTRAIGVDPAPRPAAWRDYAAVTQIATVTSDAFFQQRAREGSEGGEGLAVDLAFIDGLHLFEQVLRDFINVERHCRPDSVVVLHDTLPVSVLAAARERRSRFWCGDVWKMLPCLRRYRPDLRVLTIPTHPSGLTVIAGLDPGSRVLADAFDAAVVEWRDACLPAAAMPPAWLGDVANDERAVCAWLRPAG